MRNLGTVQVPTEAFMAVLKLEESTADEQNSDLRDGVLYLFVIKRKTPSRGTGQQGKTAV